MSDVISDEKFCHKGTQLALTRRGGSSPLELLDAVLLEGRKWSKLDLPNTVFFRV